MESYSNITHFSHELLCQILKYLPLREILSVAMLCKKMSTAVDMHLKLCKSLDFCQDAICGYMPSTITDEHLLSLLKKCPRLETVYGLHPIKIERRRLRKRSALTIPGIIEAINLCSELKAIETSDLRLFEAIMQNCPRIEIIGHFQNRDGLFPPQASQRIKLQPYPKISSLHLIGVEVPELTAMPHLQHLHLQCVRFTKLQPFRAFLAQNLRSFVMKHCIGPSVPQRYLSLIIALSSSPNLNHLELVRVPLLNGLFQRAVEDSYRHDGFVNLRTLVISGCKGVLEADLGHLMIVSSKNLQTLYIQPSLTKDSLFVSLSYAQCVFPRLQNLHLGYIDTLNSSGQWSNDALLSFGLAEVPDTPSSITDSGMKVISELFPRIKTLSVSNCPHLMIMYHWMSSEDDEAWSRLTDLTLQKCHCLQLSSFAVFIAFLSNIEVVILHDMFREPPKGCSHVGLSAGTGLGMSSAVVSNQDEHIAVQGHHQDFEHPGDEENEENEREFIDVENEEPHFMVLQRDFFDGEEEEEEEDGADVSVENQEPVVVVERLNGEEHFSVEDCRNDNSQSLNEDRMANENNFCINEPSVSVSDETSYGPSSVLSSDVQNGNPDESLYHLRETSKRSLPSMKSVHVQCNTLPSDCYESSNSHPKSVAKSSLHSGDMSDDSYRSDDGIKTCVCSKRSDFSYVTAYDPHKPSTSKAGRHLDYCIASDAKSCKVSDSETDNYYGCVRTNKRLKRSSDKQNYSKENVKKLDADKLSTRTNWSLKSNVDHFPSRIKNNHYNKVSDNSLLNSQNHLNNFNSSVDEMHKLVKPCMVLVTKLENEVPFDKTSNKCTQNSVIISGNERSSSQNETPMLASCSSSKRECDVFSESDVTEDKCPDVSVKCNNFVTSHIEKSPEISNFKVSLENDERQYWVTGAVTSEGEIIPPENMGCFVVIEKFDNMCCDDMLENCVESKELPDGSLRDNDEKSPVIYSSYSLATKKEDSLGSVDMHSEEIQKDFKHFWQDTSNDNYECMKVDGVVKTEDENSHYSGSGSYLMNGEYKMISDNATVNKLQCEYDVTVSCSEICEQCNLPCKNIHETKDVCASLDNKNSLNRNKELSADNCMSNEKLHYEILLKREGSSELHPTEDVFKISTEKKIKESEVHVIDTNCDILSVNIGAEQEALGHITVNKNEIASKFSIQAQIPKMQNGELSKSSGKKNFTNNFKNEPCETSHCENLETEKQGCSYREKACDESECTDDMKKPVCSTDKCSNFPENTPSKTCSKNSRIYHPCQPSTSKNGNDYTECTERLSKPIKNGKSLKYTKNNACVSHTRKHTNSSDLVTLSENQITGCGTSEIHSMRNTIRNENHTADNSEVNLELSPPISNRLKRTYQDHYAAADDDDTESKYYVLVSGAFAEIINSSTGESHKIPTCSVLLTQHDDETSKSHFCSEIKTKYCDCNSSVESYKESSTGMNYNPCLPSVSKQENQFHCVTETCKLQTISDVNCSQQCVANDKVMGKTYSTRSKKRIRNSSKMSGHTVENRQQDDRGDFKRENESSRKSVCKSCRNLCNHLSDISTASKAGTEKLKITNSDAAVFIKKHGMEENKRLNLHVKFKCYEENINANSLENGPYSNEVVKTESDARNDSFSEKYSSFCQNNNVYSKSEKSSPFPHSSKRTRKKRISSSQKRGKKLKKNPLVKADQSSKHTRNRSKKIPTVPIVWLISEGTQANSADIRRSVRRIRRATARARRTVSSLRVSRNSTHSNKISAKVLSKKPVNMNPQPEMHDKATSTSDPLLEDDAVQTLQLTSKTLLSFTIVSCGISDIIIDHCPKLFHIEVQACRILKKFHLNYCPAMKRLNVSQCPKLSICALAPPVMAVEPDSYFLVSYEPCMQGYHPSEGEKSILSRAALDQSVLLCHDFSDISLEDTQATFKEKLIEWFRYLSKMHAVLKQSTTESKKCEMPECSEYPWSHDLRRIHGKYTYSPSTDFCHTEGRYELLTNNPIFCDIFETHQLDAGFPAISDCEAYKDISLISSEAREKAFWMENKFIGFYIPITENNQIN